MRSIARVREDLPSRFCVPGCPASPATCRCEACQTEFDVAEAIHCTSPAAVATGPAPCHAALHAHSRLIRVFVPPIRGWFFPARLHL
jgi:hypothetical protein